jgi:tetratricopeptide (TPR) repeat protein
LKQRAIANYSEAIKIDPLPKGTGHTNVYNSRGEVYYAKGDYDQAIADYNRAIQIDQKYTASYNDRGNAYLKKGDYDRRLQPSDSTRSEIFGCLSESRQCLP